MDREGSLTPEQQSALDALHDAIVGCDVEGARKAGEIIITAGVDPFYALRHTLEVGAVTIGQKFDAGEYFLPHLVLAGDAMLAASEVLEAAVPKEQIKVKKVIVIGTVEADMHSVGKNIVAMMMKCAGFEVHDMGVDVKSTAFLSKAKEVKADIIALSSLLTTTMPYQREVIEDLVAAGQRDRVKVIVGGGPVTSEWAEKIGADGYGVDAMAAVVLAKKLVGVS